MNDKLKRGRWLERISLSSDGFLRSGVTEECLKSRGKLPVDKERLIIFVMIGKAASQIEIMVYCHANACRLFLLNAEFQSAV